MRNNVQLYINNQLVNLFDFEDINIVDSIQDIRDISKLFVPFSRQFTVPASKNNNKIFKHYYNQSITDGFDARFKITAVIKINGIVYKKGRVTLTGATLSNDKPLNYKLVFYDNTIDLKTLIGEDMLTDLVDTSLDLYNYDYTSLNVFRGFCYGYKLIGGVLDYTEGYGDSTYVKDMVVPFISMQNYYFYDSNNLAVSPIQGDSESRNISITATPPSSAVKGISHRDLRPSIRVPIVLDAIAEKYNVMFSDDFINENNKEIWTLMLWLNGDEGLYGLERSLTVNFDNFTKDSGNELRPLNVINKTISESGIYYKMKITITGLDNNDEFNLSILNKTDGNERFNGTGKGDTIFNVDLKPFNNEASILYNIDFNFTNLTSENINISCDVVKWYDASRYDGLVDYPLETSTYSYLDPTSSIFIVNENMPKIKTIDFLTSLFNIFNLTAYSDDYINIKIDTLDNYYNSGNIIDISRYVDTSNIDVNRNKLYSQISFEFEKAKTFAVVNSNEITNDEFGNEKIDNQNDDEILRSILAFDGGKYEVKPKLEKLQYERMTDQSDETVFTAIGWGWCVDKDQKPTLTNPVLHYSRIINLETESLTPNYILWDALDGISYPNCPSYHVPLNSLSENSLSRQSLHFGSEYDEYYFNADGNKLINNISLFNRYWKNYILSIYDKQSRIVTLEAYLPANLINTIKLNDVLVIRGKKYRINKLDVSITTGKTKLELITYKEIIPFYNNDYRTDIDTITIDSDLITIDTI
jgi:hypothetical protein